ncbi:MAG: hypothetical protein ACTSWR_05310 [Candidatus Helarchaeota archaeon]
MDLIINFFISFWPVIIGVIISIVVIWDLLIRKNNTNEIISNALSFKTIMNEIDFNFDTIFNNNLSSDEIKEQEDNVNILLELSKELPDIISIDGSKKNVNSFQYNLFVSDKFSLTKKQVIFLAWIIFWVGFMTFLIVRMCFYPMVFQNDGIIIAWNIFYIIIGLIEFLIK